MFIVQGLKIHRAAIKRLLCSYPKYIMQQLNAHYAAIKIHLASIENNFASS